jgi:hypothetical protein
MAKKLFQQHPKGKHTHSKNFRELQLLWQMQLYLKVQYIWQALSKFSSFYKFSRHKH